MSRSDNHEDKDFMEFINPDSLKVIDIKVEPGIKDRQVGEILQFMRIGYFCISQGYTERDKFKIEITANNDIAAHICGQTLGNLWFIRI